MISKDELKDFIVNKEITIARNALTHYSSVETRWIANESDNMEFARDTSYLATKSIAILNTLDEVLKYVDEMENKVNVAEVLED